MAIGSAYGLFDPTVLNLLGPVDVRSIVEDVYYDNDNNLILDNNTNPYYPGQS